MIEISINDIQWIVWDSFFFTFLGIILGFIFQYLFPTSRDVNYYLGFFMDVLQIILGTIVIFILNLLYEEYVARDTDTYFGLTVFSVVFFLVQPQLFDRLAGFYQHITNRPLS